MLEFELDINYWIGYQLIIAQWGILPFKEFSTDWKIFTLNEWKHNASTFVVKVVIIMKDSLIFAGSVSISKMPKCRNKVCSKTDLALDYKGENRSLWIDKAGLCIGS